MRGLQGRLNFTAIAQAALGQSENFVPRWLPDGRCVGQEWIAKNPRRADRTLGSFRINLRTGKWADFATGDKGGDLIALLAFLRGISQGQAARELMRECSL